MATKRNIKNNNNSKIYFRTSFRNTVYDTLSSRENYEECDNDTGWNILWGERDYAFEMFDKGKLDSNQKLNHFRNGRELCRKDLLIKNLKRKKRTLERDGQYQEAESYDFFPITFTLPGEYAMFVEQFKREGGIWIMKPIGSAQGKGIFLFKRLNEIKEWKQGFKNRVENGMNAEQIVESYIVQRYIERPLLIGGKKFDMRVYCLVTSFSPLIVYQYRGGFARFTSSRYSSEPGEIEDMFMHLTNVSIQRGSENYDQRTGGKFDLLDLKYFLMSKYGVERVDVLFWEMQMIFIRSLLAVQQVLINSRQCFELYGYDIMIDENLKPWLIEVNASPSLSATTEDDYNLKFALINDVLDILDLEGEREGNELHIGGFDLIYDNGYIEMEPNDAGYSSYLGSRIIRPDTWTRKIPPKLLGKKSKKR